MALNGIILHLNLKKIREDLELPATSDISRASPPPARRLRSYGVSHFFYQQAC